jgi:hypothetical protein
MFLPIQSTFSAHLGQSRTSANLQNTTARALNFPILSPRASTPARIRMLRYIFSPGTPAEKIRYKAGCDEVIDRGRGVRHTNACNETHVDSDCTQLMGFDSPRPPVGVGPITFTAENKPNDSANPDSLTVDMVPADLCTE